MSTETQEKDLLRGGQFLVRETACEDVFTLEDLSEEQKMMRESTIEFVDRELWAHWERFEKKDYAYTVQCMNPFPYPCKCIIILQRLSTFNPSRRF